MDPWPIVVSLLVAFVGSTGIAGVLTAGVQWSRSSRLRRSVEAGAQLADSVGRDTVAGRALELANQANALRLAAMSLLKPPGQMWLLVIWLIVAIVAMFGAIFAMWSGTARSAAGESGWFFGLLVGVMIGYVVALVSMLDHAIRARRERFVRAALRADDLSIATIQEHDFMSNRRDDLRAEELRARASKKFERERDLYEKHSSEPTRFQKQKT